MTDPLDRLAELLCRAYHDDPTGTLEEHPDADHFRAQARAVLASDLSW